MTRSQSARIKIFTPSDASAANTNAQNLTVKEIVARLPEDEFHVTMLCDGAADPRLAARLNTRLVKWTKRGNTLRLLRSCLFPPADIYFFPRTGPLDKLFFEARNRTRLRTALVTYIVMAMNHETGAGMMGRSIVEGDVVAGNSVHVVETIRQMFGVEARTIYDGIDRRYYFASPERRPGRASVRPLTVLYAGSFQPRKRVEMLIRQAARLPQVQFRLAGKGETEAPCRMLAQQLRCANLSFLGHLSSQQLGEEMRAADVFLFPSILEGNPQVLLQAGACGLPSIAMDLYRSDFIVHGRTGFLCASDEQMTVSLDRLLADDAMRQSFSEAAILHTNQFEWNHIAEQWSAIFRQCKNQTRNNHRQKAS